MDTIETIWSYAGRHSPAPRAGAGFVRRLSIVSQRLMAAIDACIERRRSRMALLELTDHQLKDIGISRGDAYREGIRSFWE